MLAHHYPLPGACVCVCLSHVSIVSNQLDRSSWFSAGRLPLSYPTLCYKEIWIFPKIRVIVSGTLLQTVDTYRIARSMSAIAMCIVLSPKADAEYDKVAFDGRPTTTSTSLYSDVHEAVHHVGPSATTANTC